MRQEARPYLRTPYYDSYKLAIRWASDRIGDVGVIALVTNGSFIDGNADSGLRACLADEFSHLYVFNLRETPELRESVVGRRETMSLGKGPARL